jgi:predicted nucleic acid-binding protein
MKIVADANVIIAALARPAITREVLLYPYIDYYTPDFFMEELEGHEAEIKKKIGPTYPQALSLITRKLRVISYDDYEPWLAKADEIIGRIDRDDVPYIAAALAIRADGLWSYDPHFAKQTVVKIVSIKDLILRIRKRF